MGRAAPFSSSRRQQPVEEEVGATGVNPPQSEPAEATGQAVEAVGESTVGSERRAAVDAYIAEVLSRTGRQITRTDFWVAAGYKSRSEFERWERNDPKRPNKAAHKAFSRVLSEKPHLK